MFYTRMFQEEMKRDPTNVELFDMAQSNSEHRHATAGCLASIMECTHTPAHIAELSPAEACLTLHPGGTATCPLIIPRQGCNKSKP